MSSNKTPISSNRKSVVLYDWWLMKVEDGSKLAVGGLTYKETLGPQGIQLFSSASTGKRSNLKTNENEIQVFCSAQISKRLYSDNTLETQDGIIITLMGCINRQRTYPNGFSEEVCDRFTSGFPWNWEKYDAKSVNKNSEEYDAKSRALTSIIVNDILKHCGEESYNQSASLDSVEKVSTMIPESELDQKQQSTVSSLNSTSKIIREAPETHSSQVENSGFMSNAPHEKNEAQAKRRFTRSQTKI